MVYTRFVLERGLAGDLLDRVVVRRIGPEPESSGRWPSLVGAFRMATRLEAHFWEMGLAPARD